jgi:hypothetical protein
VSISGAELFLTNNVQWETTSSIFEHVFFQATAMPSGVLQTLKPIFSPFL